VEDVGVEAAEVVEFGSDCTPSDLDLDDIVGEVVKDDAEELTFVDTGCKEVPAGTVSAASLTPDVG